MRLLEFGICSAKSRVRFNHDSIVDSLVKPLLKTEIFLRGLHGNMPQQKLNLFQLATRTVVSS
jgi:hypothetical protein